MSDAKRKIKFSENRRKIIKDVKIVETRVGQIQFKTVGKGGRKDGSRLTAAIEALYRQVSEKKEQEEERREIEARRRKEK